MSTITLSEARSILKVFEGMQLTNEQVLALLESGLLNDLVAATKMLDPSAVDPQAYQRVLGIEPYVFRVLLGGPENTNQIVSRFGFPVENSWVNQVNFPVAPRDRREISDIELVDPGRAFTREEGLGIIASANLLAPTHEHAIRFAEQHGKNLSIGRKPYVLFLQARESDESVYRHLYLCRSTERTALCMHALDRDFSADYVLAGVRPCRQF